jgi:hypothetical protein
MEQHHMNFSDDMIELNKQTNTTPEGLCTSSVTVSIQYPATTTTTNLPKRMSSCEGNLSKKKSAGDNPLPRVHVKEIYRKKSAGDIKTGQFIKRVSSSNG